MAKSNNSGQVETSSLLGRTVNTLIDGVTGIATSEKKRYIISASKILKSLRSGQFLNELKNEWDFYCKTGKINIDEQDPEVLYDSLAEILDYLDNDIPKRDIFDTLKKIFFTSTFRGINSDDVIPIQFMKIVKRLGEGELLVLFKVYKISKENSWRDKKWGVHEWLNLISEETKLKYPALVEMSETNLVDNKLLTPRTYSDGSGIEIKPNFRLTDLGVALCKYVEYYEANNTH